MWHLNDLVVAPAGGGTPRGHVSVAAAPLLLQVRTIGVLVHVVTGVGWKRQRKGENELIHTYTSRKESSLFRLEAYKNTYSLTETVSLVGLNLKESVLSHSLH